jgi:hypothetical protein
MNGRNMKVYFFLGQPEKKRVLTRRRWDEDLKEKW